MTHPARECHGAESVRVLRERQRMATVLQLALPAYKPGRVSVRFGGPIAPCVGRDVHADVIESMRVLIGSA